MLRLHAWTYGGQVGLHDFVCAKVGGTSKKKNQHLSNLERMRENSKFVGSISGQEGADFYNYAQLTKQNAVNVCIHGVFHLSKTKFLTN